MIVETQTRTSSTAVATPSGSLFQKAATRFFASPDDASLVLARFGLAAAMFPHGAQKALGWFGGMGLSGTLNAFTNFMHIPWLLALAVIASEFLGALALAAGFATRLAAFGIGATMAVAALTIHIHNGFFMNWMGNQKGEGIEYFILAITLALVLIVNGGGKWSVDRELARKAAAK